MTVEYLIVGGGGGGGAGGPSGGDSGGAGGGGGVLSGSIDLAVGAYTVTVGGGGAAATSGSNSSVTSIGTATGGGKGGDYGAPGSTGGSGGGGGGGGHLGGAGTSGQGNTGGNGAASGRGGGGGGQSAVGSNGDVSNGGNGAAGLTSSISGSAVVYGSGGGGGGGTGGAGGTGAGSGANSGTGSNATAGTANRGGGGGGGSRTGGGTALTAGAGGSGVVIIRYAGGQAALGGDSIVESGGYTIHTFTASGTFTVFDSLGGGATLTFSASGALSTTASMSGAATLTFSALADLQDANWLGTNVYVTVAGTQRATGRASSASKVLIESLSITDELDHAPNRCGFTAVGFTPTYGSRVVVRLGTASNPDILFAGTIISVVTLPRFEDASPFYQVQCIDDTWLLSQRLVTKRYSAQSATTIATDLIDTFGPAGITTTNVASGLETVDEISFTNQPLDDALTQLAKRIGGSWDVDYNGALHFFVEPEPVVGPMALTASHPTLRADAIASTTDASQVVTRVCVEAGGAQALADVEPGDTMIPVQTAEWYPSSGGTVVSGPQRITYTGTITGGDGSLVGTGIGPAAALTVAASSTAGSVTAGAHDYAYTFTTGSGESLPSPLASTSGSVSAPGERPQFAYNGPNSDTTTRVIGRTIRYKYTYSTAASAGDTTSETTPSPASIGIVTTASTADATKSSSIGINIANPSSAAVTWIRIYSSIDGGTYYFTEAIAATVGGYTLWEDLNTDITSGAEPPAANTASFSRYDLSNIALGSASVTSRKIYRTTAGGSQLKLLATIADNTTTTYQDNIADGSLGANVPTSDTSGLTQATGQVNAGATAIPVAGTGWASTTGGFAVIGNGQQVVRYTGKTATSITGIPSSGNGAITAAIAYNSTITAAPCLTGVPSAGTGAVQYTILKGDDVNNLVIVDSTIGQAALAAALGSGDGIVEAYLQDRRLSDDEARARANAVLALRELAETAIRYQCRDIRTRAGRTVVVNVGGVTGEFKIQRVTITWPTPNSYPLFDVEASSTRFSFEDLLRMARSKT